MNNQLKSLIKISATIACIIFIILYIINKPNSIQDCIYLALRTIGISVLLSILYEKYIWKYNPLIKIPKLKNQYKGFIRYNYKGNNSEKNIEIKIKQTLTSVCIKLISDETKSNTITSSLIEENGEFVLYYVYITNPKSQYSNKNPIQIGACRLTIDKTDEITGIYWTNRKTIGDLYLQPIDDKK